MTRLIPFTLLSASRRRLPVLLLCVAAFGLVGCGSTQPAPQPAPAPTPKAPEPAPQDDLSTRGTPVGFGEWVKLLGYNTVWVRETPILITLKKTAWDEIDGAREGRATLVIEKDGKKRTMVISEGDIRPLAGFKIELKTAFEEYRDGRYEPMVQFRLNRQ